ncbi:MAG: flagellar M-ring protein FliF [Roseovarius sp.]|nr:flagellar M-ring protein FliF [Roseovarius sp.]
MALLYAGLESGPAGEVVGALEQRDVAYEVRGGAIFVDAARRDELRMTLAGEGLPRNSAQGYELLDGLSGFGTTSQMFNAAYWRAKEGELARTIVSHPAVASARVHIAQTGTSPFRRELRPTASVAVSATAGRITAAHAQALKYLVASAVAGMAPEDVSVIDGNGELVGDADRSPAGATDGLSETLRHRVERLLAARVGPGNAVVEVSVETVTRSESLRERVIDPDSRVAISTDTEEREDAASGEGGGVTVASNLPEGDAGAGRLVQPDERNPRAGELRGVRDRAAGGRGTGAIKRLMVAVLVNGTVSPGQNGEPVFQPRPADELAALEQLVSSAVGYDAARGDAITIKSMQFEQVAPAGTGADRTLLPDLGLDAMSLVQAAVLAVVALVLGLFVVRPLLARPGDSDFRRLTAPQTPGARTETPGQSAGTPAALTGEIDTGDGEATAMTLISGATGGDNARTATALPGTRPPRTGDGGIDPAQRLRELIGERRDETVEILRSWLEGEEESA